MKTQIAIIKDRKVFRVEALLGTKIIHGDRSMDVDLEIAGVSG
jgi:hypothetical protein